MPSESRICRMNSGCRRTTRIGFSGWRSRGAIWTGRSNRRIGSCRVDRADPSARTAGTMETSLGRLGVTRERRACKAHVRRARVKGRLDLDRVRRILEAHATEEFGTHPVDAVHLKKSVLTPQGARYSVVETVRLNEGTTRPAEGGHSST